MRIAEPYSNSEWLNDYEYRCESTNIKLSRRERRAKRLHTRTGKLAFLKSLRADGFIRQSGCDCTHCMNDWDCCGRWIVQHTEIVLLPGRLLRINQYLARNL